METQRKMEMEEAGGGRKHKGCFSMKDVHLHSEWIVGINQIAVRLR